MAPSALVVRPVTCAVPIRPSCPVVSLAATAASAVVVRALTWELIRGLHLRGRDGAELRTGEGGNILGADVGDVSGAQAVQRGVDTPLKPLVDSAEICVVLMLVPGR